MPSMTLDDEPVIISEKDFRPSPSPSPINSEMDGGDESNNESKQQPETSGTVEHTKKSDVNDESHDSNHVKDIKDGKDDKEENAEKADQLNTSAIVSDEEDAADAPGVVDDPDAPPELIAESEPNDMVIEPKNKQETATIISTSISSSNMSGTSDKQSAPNPIETDLDQLLTDVTDSPPLTALTDLTDQTDPTDAIDEVAPYVPSARQIVSIGTSSNSSDPYAFTFHEEELNAILSKIPPGWNVCVVSVVGAFRTGKSFLLSWFLRYLEQNCLRKGGKGGIAGEGGAGAGIGKGDDGKKWYERVHTLNQHDGSFDWRGGTERNTTGIWMWSDPYFLPHSEGGKQGGGGKGGKNDEVAVLLVDTQGMFDHETTVGLTAAIFGLSTLLSSFQIYNVDKRIQEDNLQQLALFSEYGRMAFEAEEKAAAMGVKSGTAVVDDESDETEPSSKKASTRKPPFQKIEFLVRDWQNFDTEDEEDIASMESEMSVYLEGVLAEREASDLKETRDQIHSCFEEISCFMMTHPGFAVIKNKYEGDVSKIDGLFLRLLDRYCQRVFDTMGSNCNHPRLQPKTVRGRKLTAVELGTYIKSYAQMFEEIGAHFPKAETMLEATSKANNANAVAASVDAYAEVMNSFAGPRSNDYHRPEELRVKHREASQRALMAFDDMANFGNRKAIEEAREKVVERIEKDYAMFVSLNDGRNPLLGLETYILPMFVAAISYVLRWVADFSCSSWSQTCRASSDFLSHLYMVVFFFLAIVAATKAKQITDLIDRIRAAFRVMSGNGGGSGGRVSSSDSQRKKND